MTRIRLLTGLLALAALTGCCAASAPAPGTGGAAPGGERLLRLAIETDPSTLDPALAVDVLSGQLLAKVFGGLVRFDPDLVPVPDAAERIDVSPDGRVYTFALRAGLAFSDGSPATASDVVASFRRVLAPDSLGQRKWVLKDILGAEAFQAGRTTEIAGLVPLGDRTLEITLAAPQSSFLPLLAMPNAALVKEKEGTLLGTGPYRIREFRRGERIDLEPNPHYAGADRYLDGIRIGIVKDSTAAYAAFAAGNLDLLNLPPDLAQRLVASEEFMRTYQVTSRPKLNVYYLGLNCRKGPFANADVRRALNYAVDAGAIIEGLKKGCAVKATGPIPPTLRTWAAPAGYAPDRTKAIELLAAAGYSRERPLRFTLHYKSSDNGDVAMVLKDQLAGVGVVLVPAPLEWGGLKARINNGEVEAAYLNWTADYPDPQNFFFPLFYGANAGAGGNRAFYASPEYDELMKRSESITNKSDLNMIYSTMENLVVKDAPWVFLWHEIEFAAARKGVTGYEVPRIYTMDRGTGIRLE